MSEKGVNLVTCNECGEQWNASLPGGHECGPDLRAESEQSQAQVETFPVIDHSGGDGVNMTTCRECGASYNAALPGGHRCGPIRAPRVLEEHEECAK